MNLCGFEAGPDRPLFLIAGPCVIESERLALESAETLRDVAGRLGIGFIYKSSFDKANRTSGASFRGPGHRGGAPDPGAGSRGARGAGPHRRARRHPHRRGRGGGGRAPDPGLPLPPDRLHPAGGGGRPPVNIKKGQFLAPWDMVHVVEKARSAGNDRILVCERGVSFGYNYLVSDMRSLAVLRETGCPVVFDATHSVQMPGGMGAASGGQREFVPVLARAAVGAGVSGLFMETHPNPDEALSDGPNAVPLDEMEPLLETLVAIDRVVKPARVAARPRMVAG